MTFNGISAGGPAGRRIVACLLALAALIPWPVLAQGSADIERIAIVSGAVSIPDVISERDPVIVLMNTPVMFDVVLKGGENGAENVKWTVVKIKGDTEVGKGVGKTLTHVFAPAGDYVVNADSGGSKDKVYVRAMLRRKSDTVAASSSKPQPGADAVDSGNPQLSPVVTYSGGDEKKADAAKSGSFFSGNGPVYALYAVGLGGVAGVALAGSLGESSEGSSGGGGTYTATIVGSFNCWGDPLPVNETVTFRVTGSTITASGSSLHGGPFTGTVNGGHFRIQFTDEWGMYQNVFEGTISGDTISGTYTIIGCSGSAAINGRR